MYNIVKEEEFNRLFRDIKLAPYNFVPIIGPELMIYKIDGEWTNIENIIAKQLADELQIIGADYWDPKHYSLNDVINTFYLNEKDFTIDTPYRIIKNILTTNKWEIPEPVKKLASITHFKFYINATWIPFITDALITNDRNETVIEKSNSIGRELDDFDSYDEKDEIVRVYHLFGNAKEPDCIKFGLTDDDILHLSHNLITNCPVNLNLFLKDKSRKLLLWGCNFSSWLTRLIFYSIRREEVFSYTSKSIYFVGGPCSNNPSLESFWHRLNSNICKDTDAYDIVDKFYDKWKIQLTKTSNSLDTIIGEKNLFRKNSVFISYDRNDQKKAIGLYEKLQKIRIPAWLDLEDIQGGEYKEKIRFNIMNCSVFVPIVSLNSIANIKRNGSMYKLEWLFAKEVYNARVKGAGQSGYIVPVKVDIINFDNPTLPEFIKDMHGYDIDDEKLIEALVNGIINYQKINQE